MSTETKQRRPRAKKKAAPEEFWAVAVVYEFMRLGGTTATRHGPLWFPKRFKAVGTPIKVGKYDCYSFLDPVAMDWKVYEKTSGGMMGSGSDEGTAIAVAIANVATTPDLDQQMKRLGPVMGKEEIETNKALRMLAKSKDKAHG